MESRSFVSIVVAVVFMAGTPVAAAEETRRSGFWGGIDIGAGYVERSVESLESNGTDIYMGFKAGYVLHPQVLPGQELGGDAVSQLQLRKDRRSEAPDSHIGCGLLVLRNLASDGGSQLQSGFTSPLFSLENIPLLFRDMRVASMRGA
jgi:hypothetical protein